MVGGLRWERVVDGGGREIYMFFPGGGGGGRGMLNLVKRL